MDIQVFTQLAFIWTTTNRQKITKTTLEKILKFPKGANLIKEMDSNSRSTNWHDVLTNYRGKLLEEFFASNQLHIINEDSTRTTFQSSRGSSNIDFTSVNNHMLATIKDWEIPEKSRIIFPLNGVMSYPCICLIACHIHGTIYRVASICFCIFQRCTSHRTMYMTCYKTYTLIRHDSVKGGYDR